MINHGHDEVYGRPTPTEKRHGDLHAFAERERFDKILTADLNMTVQTVPRVPTVVYHLHSGALRLPIWLCAAETAQTC